MSTIDAESACAAREPDVPIVEVEAARSEDPRREVRAAFASPWTMCRPRKPCAQAFISPGDLLGHRHEDVGPARRPA